MSDLTNQKRQPSNPVDSLRNTAINQFKPEDTTVFDCLEIVQKEYEIERAKRQSFETRAGIIITLLAAICVFMFEQINLIEIVCSFELPLTLHILLYDLSAAGVYVCFGFALYYAIKTIDVKVYNNFNVSAINEGFMGKPRLEGCIEITKSYRDIVIQHRQVNADSAKSLSNSFKCVIGVIVFLIIYINAK